MFVPELVALCRGRCGNRGAGFRLDGVGGGSIWVLILLTMGLMCRVGVSVTILSCFALGVLDSEQFRMVTCELSALDP